MTVSANVSLDANKALRLTNQAQEWVQAIHNCFRVKDCDLVQLAPMDLKIN
jgi:hypothetical protein